MRKLVGYFKGIPFYEDPSLEETDKLFLINEHSMKQLPKGTDDYSIREKLRLAAKKGIEKRQAEGTLAEHMKNMNKLAVIAKKRKAQERKELTELT